MSDRAVTELGGRYNRQYYYYYFFFFKMKKATSCGGVHGSTEMIHAGNDKKQDTAMNENIEIMAKMHT